jgi:hypothetical protein
MTIKGPVDVTSDNPETYNSSHLTKFAWTDDPAGTQGLLFVGFSDGGGYVYKDVPETEFDELERRSSPDSSISETTGQYFHKSIVNVYTEEEVDYNRFEDVLD